MKSATTLVSMAVLCLSIQVSGLHGCSKTSPPGSGQCSSIDDCPSGEACFAGVCQQLCSVDGDCRSAISICVDDHCEEIDNATCTSDSECTSPGICEGAIGDCKAGECTYSALAVGSPCDDADACTSNTACDASLRCVGTAVGCISPPANECTQADSVLISYGTPGSCESSTGQCDYPTVESACANCTAACLGLCDRVTCDDADPCTVDTCVGGTCETAPYAGSCDDGDPCTDHDSCSTGTCAGILDLACPDGGLEFSGVRSFSPHPTTGGTQSAPIGSYHPSREIWCLLVGTTTHQFPSMASTTVSIGGTELTQTTLTAAGLDVGAPSSFDGWYGRIASYRLAASAQEAAGVVEESSASFTVSAADISDTYRLYIWRYYAPPGTSFRGVKGDHTSDADDVTTRTISPTMLVGGDVASINASPRSSANVVAFALSVATQATTSPSIASTALFGGTGLVQDHSNGNMVAGSAHILSYTPVGGTESWDLVTASHPGANGVAMHVITAAYW